MPHSTFHHAMLKIHLLCHTTSHFDTKKSHLVGCEINQTMYWTNYEINVKEKKKLNKEGSIGVFVADNDN